MKFNEDCRVKIPATVHMIRLGYEYLPLNQEDYDVQTNINLDILKNKLSDINNREIGDIEFEEIMTKIRTYISFNDGGKKFYDWLVNPGDEVKLIDLEEFDNNSFHVVNELTFGMDSPNFRPDITILINGIPIGFIEVKPPNNEGGIQSEFSRMINYRLENPDLKKFFYILQIMGFSNNMEYLEVDEIDNTESMEKKQGSFYCTGNGKDTEFNYFREEEDIKINKEITKDEIIKIIVDNNYDPELYDESEFQTNLSKDRPVNRFTTSIFSRERLQFFLKYGIMYVGKQKHIMRYPQFFAVKNIIQRTKKGIDIETKEGKEKSRPYKRGIVWHAQGSGKTALAAFTNIAMQDYFRKQGKITRFFFVVDRKDLLIQATNEFIERRIAVKNVNSKTEFVNELKRNISSINRQDSIGEMTVVNIQGIMAPDTPLEEVSNEYEANVQRIIFIDEAHRSYSSGGSFLANLMTIDPNAIYIALTGTPIINEKEKTRLKFGEYYHKYFYDKSIADGYTLKLKREPIKTLFHDEIKRNIEIDEAMLQSTDIINSDNYVNLLAKYIDEDFTDFRLINDDESLGGMIVAANSIQAKKLQKWYENNSKLKTAIVLYDTDDNKDIQEDFKKTDKDSNYRKYDLLIVYMMLTTGYSVNRLKKMYILRKPDKHALLQTISRVNRPYKNPKSGRQYPYGYLVDFADIEKNYNKTIEKYTEELERDTNESGEEDISLSGLIEDPQIIYNRYRNLLVELEDLISINNIEEFSIQLGRYNKDTILKIKRILNSIKTCYTEFILSDKRDYIKEVDIDKIKAMYKEVERRIKFINLLERPVEEISKGYLNNEEIITIIYEFIKLKSYILDLSKFIDQTETGRTINNIINEVKKSKNINTNRMIKLDEALKKVLEKLKIADIDELKNIDEELSTIYSDLQNINEENEKLAKEFNGDYGYVKTLYDCIEEYPDIDKEALVKFLKITQKYVDKVIITNKQLYRKRNLFIATIESKSAEEMFDAGLFDEIDMEKMFGIILRKVYGNVNLVKHIGEK